jgi:hypothetical protein
MIIHVIRQGFQEERAKKVEKIGKPVGQKGRNKEAEKRRREKVPVEKIPSSSSLKPQAPAKAKSWGLKLVLVLTTSAKIAAKVREVTRRK